MDLNKLFISVIITAGGSGRRMGAPVKKQYLEIGGKPILAWTIQAFQQMEWIDEILLIVPEEDMQFVAESIVDANDFDKIRRIISGGTERQESVYNGLLALNPHCEYVLIHDGVRPFVSDELASTLVLEAMKNKSIIPGVPVKETLKEIEKDIIQNTIDRSKIWSIQTPQVFDKALILKAHNFARESDFFGTDDASLLERIGEPVHVVEGDSLNIKITTPKDLLIANRISSLYFPTQLDNQ